MEIADAVVRGIAARIALREFDGIAPRYFQLAAFVQGLYCPVRVVVEALARNDASLQAIVAINETCYLIGVHGGNLSGNTPDTLSTSLTRFLNNAAFWAPIRRRA